MTSTPPSSPFPWVLGTGVTIAADARSATASCRVAYDFDAQIGGRQRQTVPQVFTFEKRGDAWIITGIR